MEEIKSWKKMLELGYKLTIFNRQKEIKFYPLRREFNPTAPHVVKPALKRDFEIGLVYPIDEEIMKIRELVGLDKIPPTAHLFERVIERKRKLLKIFGIMEELGYEEGKFRY
ncbi:MAG: hypothetical protein QXW34_05240 [Candidatus Methanomethyliaceae archaeon]